MWATNKVTPAFGCILAKAVPLGKLYLARNHMLGANYYVVCVEDSLLS